MSRPGAEDAGFLRSFEDATLPPGRFHHEGHVHVAWLMLGQDDLPEALRRFRQGRLEAASFEPPPGLAVEARAS